MSTQWVVLAYALTVGFAFLLLYYFEPVGWFWHLLSAAAALAIGLAPIPAQLNTAGGTILIGCVFLFLFVWGVGGGFFRFWNHHSRHGKQASKHA